MVYVAIAMRRLLKQVYIVSRIICWDIIHYVLSKLIVEMTESIGPSSTFIRCVRVNANHIHSGHYFSKLKCKID